MIYEYDETSEYSHRMVFNINNEQKFFKAMETSFSMNVQIEIDSENKEVTIDKDRYEYFCEVKNEIMNWLSNNMESSTYLIEKENSGKTVIISFKEKADLVLFKLSCL